MKYAFKDTFPLVCSFAAMWCKVIFYGDWWLGGWFGFRVGVAGLGQGGTEGGLVGRAVWVKRVEAVGVVSGA